MVALMLFGLSSGSGYALAAEKVTCTTSKCHSDMGNQPFKHSPLSATNGCLVCHKKGTGQEKLPPKHFPLAALPKSEINEACKSCHDSFAEPGRTKRYPHETHGEKIKDGCLSCHDAHTGKNKNLLKPDEPPELCWTCHKDRKHLHQPLIGILNTDRAKRVHLQNDKVYCLTCHNPHKPAAEKESLLWFCSSCHGNKAESLYKNYHKRTERPALPTPMPED